MDGYVLVNFGGPRHLGEIASFLEELLCDKDVIPSKLPALAHDWLFKRIARKRALKIRHDYEMIGGKSPIYFDTEAIAQKLAEKLKAPVLTFHRYLKATHEESLKRIAEMEADEIRVLPLFPQFCYATTGSIARFFSDRLPLATVNKLRWVHSYATHPAFIRCWRKKVADFLDANRLKEEETILLFSAHGVPQSFIDKGDLYESECNSSFKEVLKGFPNALGRLSYQSKFGPEEWIKPYTDETCGKILEWGEGRKNGVIVPITFTSDHIETLFEIEQQYIPLIREKGLNALRCPALNLEPYWIDALAEIYQQDRLTNNQMLIRR